MEGIDIMDNILTPHNF